jgi:hypothetical protein
LYSVLLSTIDYGPWAINSASCTQSALSYTFLKESIRIINLIVSKNTTPSHNNPIKIKQMKYLNHIVTALAVVTFTACKKDKIETAPLTSLTMVNAVAGGVAVKLGSNATTINNNNANGTQMAIIAGETDLYIWPVGDSLHPYFTYPKFVSQDREVYSIFLCGTPGATEGIVVKESIPYRTDSTAGIRFINLAPNKPSITITLSASPTVDEVTGLAYKSYTDFKTYPGKFNSTYSFQVRDATNPGTVLTTFTLTAAQVPRFANITVVIRQNGTGVAAFRVNQDR